MDYGNFHSNNRQSVSMDTLNDVVSAVDKVHAIAMARVTILFQA